MRPGKLSDHLLGKKERGEKVLVSYLVAGYPNKQAFQKHLGAVLGISDLVEIGLPFSDPLADGSTIQQAYQQVLAQGLDMDELFQLLAPAASRSPKPLVLMSYLNPVLRYGLEKLALRLSRLNVRGILFPDLPLEESQRVRRAVNRFDLELICLLSPATSLGRASEIINRSQAFVYFVSLKGVTGSRKEISAEALHYLRAIRRLSSKPLYAGFGISQPRQVSQLKPWVDGVIVGSALLDRLGKGGGETAKRFLTSLKEELLS